MSKKKSSKKFIDNDKKEEDAVKKVMASAKVPKGKAVAILKNQGTLKQKKGERGLMVKKKNKR